MSIYTGHGDGGETSLADTTRVSKASARVEAFGAVDEACAAVGFARAGSSDPVLNEALLFIQQRLFNCAASLARTDGSADPGVSKHDLTALERMIDAFAERSGPLSGFVLGGSGDVSARLHVARTVTRRAERRVVALAHDSEVSAGVLALLNRFSDVLFAAARYADAVEENPEEPWNPTAAPPPM